MANSTASDSISNQKRRDVFEEEGINKISSLINHQKIAEIKSNQSDLVGRGSQKQATLENMKANGFCRTKSNDKNAHASQGCTGGSQAFQNNIIKKPTLRLNTNLINTNNSIGVPQTTQNNHSSRMINYQQSQQQNQSSSNNQNQQIYRTSFASTPKAQSQVQTTISNNTLIPNQNYTSTLLISKHRSQLSGSQIKQGTQGSQVNLSNPTFISGNLQNFNPSIVNQQTLTQSQIDVVKVGTSIPKTTTAANLKNFNNLRQFNQLFNHGKSQNQQSQNINATNPQSSDKPSQQTDEVLLSEANNQQKQHLLQIHQKHLQQQSQSKTSHQSKQKSTQLQDSDKAKVTQKNLQITIPQSPRTDQSTSVKESNGSKDDHEQPCQSNVIGMSFLQSSLSTKNSNQGHIKLNKFTCHSTRNNTQKQSIFSQQQQKNSEKKDDTAETPSSNDLQNQDSMQLQPAHKIIIPNHESTKHSLKRNGVVRAYAANTNQGLVRNYNEDRVSIILNILKPPNRQAEHWPRCSFFGIYDGHGGSACADFLRDNLHQFVIKESSFPSNPKEALKCGFANAEKKFMELCQNENGIIDKSGSCAIVVLIVEDMCYVANVGDSRSILSSEEGKRIFPLSRDHKPCDELERKRIVEGGGQIYHRTATANDSNNPSKKEIIVGPLRVLPGRLSVSRTFGDAEAKLAKFGGNPNVVIATPEIKSFRITKEHDFIVLACDGIFDKLNNQETIQCVWNSVQDNKQLSLAQNIHKQSGVAVEYILKNALLRRTLDNVTVVMIAFNNFKHAVFGQGKATVRQHGTTKEQSKNYSSQVSTDNSQVIQTKKKENIPPSFKQPEEYQEKQSSSKGGQSTNRLQIDTNQNSSSQGPKTTTNAQLHRESSTSTTINQVTQNNIGRKMQQQISTSSNARSKHFDFSNV